MWALYTDYMIGYKNDGSFNNIMPYANNLQWTDDKDTLAVTLTFDSILDLAEGRSHVILKKDNKIVFYGVMTQKVNKDKSSSYTVQDYAFYLNKNEDIFQCNGINAKEAIYQLLAKYYIGGAVIPLNTKITKFYKGKTIADIIKDIISQCSSEINEDVIMEMRSTVLWIDKVSNLKLDCQYILANDFQITRSMEDMVNSVIVSSNTESDASILAQASDENNIQIFGRMTKVLTVDGQNESQAQNTAQNYLNNFNSTKRELTVTLLDVAGCEDIRANRKINIQIPKYGMDGYYGVKSAQHTLANSIHKIAVTIDFSNANFVDSSTTGSD
ncbi:hypothetical protein AB8U03_15730 [Clostridium sp. Mt-5]|uniref:YqbQ/XkdQ domain-containing protein n=1 Tax=Clostridium moutaii TaxID=3240932 RepID=A0ABV4BVT3_9CLOT